LTPKEPQNKFVLGLFLKFHIRDHTFGDDFVHKFPYLEVLGMLLIELEGLFAVVFGKRQRVKALGL
jgi:hypothetical protein